jgi:hypothetical protein
MHSVWAVATNTIRQALRMKTPTAFVVLLLILLPVMGISATGDGTLKGRLQTFVSYGLSLTSILLSLLTIIVSAYSLTSDIQQKQIYTVVTKPIRRAQLLLGKLLGVILLNVVLLVLFSAIIYGITVYTPRYFNVTEAELSKLKTRYAQALEDELQKSGASYSEQSEAQLLQSNAELYHLRVAVSDFEARLAQINNEFFTARTSIVPVEADVDQEVKEIYQKRKESGQLPEDMSVSEIMKELTGIKRLEKRAAGVGHQLLWEFHDVKPRDPNASLFVRFKYDVSNPSVSQVYSQWFIGDYRQIRYGTEPKTAIYETPVRSDPVRTARELEFPADAVAEDGYLAVGFTNVPLNDTVVIFPLEDGLEVLYKADTFTANFLRAVLLILFRLIFLACLGLLAGTFLSFPVAILFCLVVFLTATFSGFVLESFDSLGENLIGVYSYTVRPVIQLLPQFDKFNPTKFLVPARLLSWALTAKVGALVVAVKGLLLLLLSLLIFNFKEIAKITV